MLRPLLVLASLTAASACSTVVGSAPGLDAGTGETGPTTNAVAADLDSTIDDSTIDDTTVESAPDETTIADLDTTTSAATTTVPPTTTATTTVPASTTVAPEDPAFTPPVEPIVAVWQEDGPETQRAQELLLSLGFWLAEPNGEYGQTTTQAVMAFQKYYGLAADGKLGPETAAAMSSVTERPEGRSTGGTLVEVDKSKQLLFLVRDGATEWVLNTSTGTEIPYREPDQNTPGVFIEDDSITRPGVFAVDRQREEGWWEGDLGEIYRPKYFDGGIALHGSYNIPPYPASHGCVRLSIQAMDWIWAEELVPMGTTVWVHGEIPDRDA